MTNRQYNKLRMYGVVEMVLNDTVSIWNIAPAYLNAKNAFSADLANLRIELRKQMEPTTGITEDKRALKKNMIQHTMRIAAGVAVYAQHINSAELYDAVRLTHRLLIHSRDTRFLARCTNIHDLAATHLPALADYGITPAALAAMQSAIDNYKAKLSAPRAARSERSAVTKSLAAHFTRIDRTLKLVLDNLFTAFSQTETEFYNTYKAARNILDLGGKHSKTPAPTPTVH